MRKIKLNRKERLSRKSLLFLVPGFPKHAADTSCIPALQNYIFHAAAVFPDTPIRVITFQYPFTTGKYRWQGIEVYSCGGRNRGKWRRLITWAKALFFGLLAYRKSPITTIHSFWLNECALVGQVLARVFRARHIASLMGQEAQRGNRYLERLDYREMVLTGGSATIAAAFRNATGQAVQHIIPLGLDVEKFPCRRPSPPRTIDIIGVGSLTPLKNFQLFVEIIAELTAEHPALNCVIIGDGSEYEKLREMIARRRLREHIRLTGHLPRPRVIDYLYKSKILLHPSGYESQGYVFMEALYCGLTVVAYDVGYLEPSEKVFLCQDKREMQSTLAHLLTRKLSHDALVLKSVDETAQDFWKLYA